MRRESRWATPSIHNMAKQLESRGWNQDRVFYTVLTNCNQRNRPNTFSCSSSLSCWRKLARNSANPVPAGYWSEECWPRRRCLNRLRTRTGCCKVSLVKWGIKTGDTTCDWRTAEETMEHTLECPDLPPICSIADLMTYNPVDVICLKRWMEKLWQHEWWWWVWKQHDFLWLKHNYIMIGCDSIIIRAWKQYDLSAIIVLL